jgi:hypothetical protein
VGRRLGCDSQADHYLQSVRLRSGHRTKRECYNNNIMMTETAVITHPSGETLEIQPFLHYPSFALYFGPFFQFWNKESSLAFLDESMDWAFR